MKKIDRLGWSAGISFTAYGARIGIRTNETEVLDEIASRLPPGWKPSASPLVDLLYSLRVGRFVARANSRQFNLLYKDFERLARAMDLGEVFDIFESSLQIHVAEAARRRVFVHAGVVGWRGQAILIPGRTFSGKTSLVAELVRAGASYYSDEYAVLDAQGRVHPYPRPLAIREGSDSRQKRCSVESLGGCAGVKPLPVGLVVLSQYRPGAKWRPRQLSVGQGILELLDNTVPARRRPADVLGALGPVAADAQIIKGVRGEASDVVRSVLNCLTSRACG